ncbi:carbohydrate ABC transporter membrane protein 2 (CUT1 family) [Arthrobacter sp. SLBN-100]|uniref:carbohydrate ABC transporter permease n=1 Tax=Arthrobacter sp. SLBN-100 TaxID=2768450 RepID=UPI0011688093|nr:carbohydrate ABC transporter membrane protein 2 (CUT1 family) [Arthrobacter sp. SLBN-100]
MTTQTTLPGKAATAARKQPRTQLSEKWLYVPMVLLALFFLFPIVFMLVSSFKTDAQIFSDMRGGISAFLPTGPLSLENYAQVFQKVPVGRFLLNSLVVSTATVVLGLVVNSMLGFALARMRWKGKGFVFAVILATLIVPFDAIAIPLLFEATKLPKLEFHGMMPVITLNWLNTYYVQIIPFIVNAFSVFLFRQYFSSIPAELDEAARVDGASWFTIYRKIAIPLAGPAFATVAILTFLPAWNQYLWPLMAVQSEELRPLNVGMDYFFQLKTSWGQVMAYASIIVTPVVLVFLSFQRAFVSSIASAGVKG